MAKKWTTVRKPGAPDSDSDATGENKSPASQTPVSRIPRRRQLARQRELIEQQFAEANLNEKGAPSASATGDDPKVPRPLDVENPEVLVVHDASAAYRLVEETLSNFTRAQVDSTPDVLVAFELAIRKEYQLFVIALKLPGISGSLFYELISRAYSTGLGKKRLAPAVVFVREADEPLPPDELIQDVRVKAVWSKPLSIERMLDTIPGVIRMKEEQTG